MNPRDNSPQDRNKQLFMRTVVTTMVHLKAHISEADTILTSDNIVSQSKKLQYHLTEAFGFKKLIEDGIKDYSLTTEEKQEIEPYLRVANTQLQAVMQKAKPYLFLLPRSERRAKFAAEILSDRAAEAAPKVAEAAAPTAAAAAAKAEEPKAAASKATGFKIGTSREMFFADKKPVDKVKEEDKLSTRPRSPTNRG